LRVSALRGEDGEALAARAQAGAPGAVLLHLSQSLAQRSTLILDVPRSALPTALVALARDPAVEFVAAERRVRPANLDATWILQSGVSNSRPLFKNAGITGVGQVVALADMGLD